MGTLNGIEYDELEGSGALVYTDEGIKGRRIFIVDWDDRIEFCKALLGYTQAVGHSPVRRRAATFPGYDYLYCQHAESTGLGAPSAGGEMIAYTKAKIIAEYSPLNFGSSGSEDDEFDPDEEAALAHLQEVWDFAGEFTSVAGSEFEYGGTGESPAEPVGVFVGTVDLTLSSDFEPELPRAAIRSVLGKVNSTSWYGAAPECVLFLGASARRTITAEGARAWHISYRFRERQVSWNKKLKGSQWIDLSPKPYQTAHFTVLF